MGLDRADHQRCRMNVAVAPVPTHRERTAGCRARSGRGCRLEPEPAPPCPPRRYCSSGISVTRSPRHSNPVSRSVQGKTSPCLATWSASHEKAAERTYVSSMVDTSV